MSNWKPHLPQVGVLVLSAALAAGAYSVYAGQTGGSSPSTAEPAAGLTLESPSSAVPAAKSRESSREDRHEVRRQAPANVVPASSVTGPTSPAPAALLPAPAEGPAIPLNEGGARSKPGDGEVRDPGRRDREMIDQEHLGGDQLDQELRNIGQGAPPPTPLTPEPAPTDLPEGEPVDEPVDDPPDPGATPSDPPLDEPVDDPPDPGATPSDPPEDEPVDEPVDEPADPGATPTPAEPPSDPGTAPPTTQPEPSGGGDPDAGLDDTAVGGLDQSDLGAPVDESPAGGPGAAPPAAQAP